MIRKSLVLLLALLALAAPTAAGATPVATPHTVSISGQGCGATWHGPYGRIKACDGFSPHNAGVVYGHVYFTQSASIGRCYLQFRTMGVNLSDESDWGYMPTETHLCPGPGRSMDWITNSYRVLSNRRYAIFARVVTGAGSTQPWARSLWLYVR
jgi:hypothetical protein